MKKDISGSILISLFLIMILSNSVMGLPALPSTQFVQDETIVTISDNGLNDTYERIAYVAEPGTPSDVFVSAEQPFSFEWVDSDNASLGAAVTHENYSYPAYLSSVNTGANMDPTPDPWSTVSWLYIDNATTLDANSTNDVSVSLTSEVIGSIKHGVRKEFEVPVVNALLELRVEVHSTGLHLLFYDNDISPSSPRLVSPQGLDVDISTMAGNLPDFDGTAWSASSASSIRDFYGFIAHTTGIYRFYFSMTSKRYLNFELKHYGENQTLNLNDRVIYKDKEYNEINPETLQEPGNGLPVHVYAIDFSNPSAFLYNFESLWASPYAYLAIPITDKGATSYVISSISQDGIDHPYGCEKGRVYLIVINEAYWTNTWQTRLNFMYYRFILESVDNIAYTLGTQQKFELGVDGKPKMISFSVSEPTLAIFNATTLSGTITYDIANGLGYRRNGVAYTSTLLRSQSIGENARYLYWLQPGEYLIDVYPACSLTPQTMELNSWIVTNGTQESVYNKVQSGIDEAIANSSATKLDFEHYYVNDIVNGTEGSDRYPILVPVNLSSNPFNIGYNLTYFREDNAGIPESESIKFRVKATFVETSPYDDETFITLGSNTLTYTQIQTDNNETSHYSSYYSISSVSEMYLVMWPYDVQVTDNGTWIPYNDTLTLRVATFDQEGYYHDVSASLVEPSVQMDDLNWTIYDDFSLEESINGSITPVLRIRVHNNQTIDWYQIAISLNNSDSGSFAYVLFDYDWDDISGYINSTQKTLFNPGSTNMNFTGEFGSITGDFWLIIFANPDDDQFNVQYKVNIAAYNVPILQADVNYGPLSDLDSGLPSWVIPTSIVGGVVIAGGIAFFFYKKKHPV